MPTFYYLEYLDTDGRRYRPSSTYASIIDAQKDAELFFVKNKAFVDALVYDSSARRVSEIKRQSLQDFKKVGEAVDLSKLQDQANDVLDAIKLEKP